MPIPYIHQIDDSGRYFLISDLGAKSLFDHRREAYFQDFYTKAIELLVLMQINGDSLKSQLPQYDDDLLQAEMELFKEWFCFYELGLNIKQIEKIDFNPLFSQLSHRAIQQDKVFVHRDFHSRNIMISYDGELGLIDFKMLYADLSLMILFHC